MRVSAVTALRVVLSMTVVALASTFIGCGAPQNGPSAPENPSPAPLESSFDGDFADPFVFRAPDAYYALATGVGRLHLQIAQSADLERWVLLGEALPVLPRWALQQEGLTWAPSALARRDRYVVYYATRDAASGFQCISRALAVGPTGPYIDESSRPLVCQVGPGSPFCGSIDPSPFLDYDGTPYLLWKSDENSSSCRTDPRIWAQRLTDDGLSVVGAAETLLALDQRWEDTIIEGPSMFRHAGRYYLFYSANAYESGDYAVGYATCEGPFGPCAKETRSAPYLMSAGSMRGPGGQEIFEDANGATRMAYHAWTAPKTTYAAGGARSLRIARLAFAANGAPEVPMTP